MRVLGGENCLRSTNPVNIYTTLKLKKARHLSRYYNFHYFQNVRKLSFNERSL